MPNFYLTRIEIFSKFNIALPSIDKVNFTLQSENNILVEVSSVDTIWFKFSVKKVNNRIYREILNEFDNNIKLKISLSKLLETIEDNFDRVYEILQLSNFEYEYKTNRPSFESGSKARIKVGSNLYIDINTENNIDCLLFLDSACDLEYGYYTILDVISGEIKSSSILDNQVLNVYKQNKKDLVQLASKQNKLKVLMEWK